MLFRSGTDKNIPINKQVEIPQNTLKQSFSKDDIPSTFDKLYKESEKKKRNLIKREIISQEIELEGCTFSPNILVTSSNNSEIYKTESSPYERLYKDFQKRNESLKQRQKELAEENHRLSSMVFTNVPGCKTRNKETDRKSVVYGKSDVACVDRGGGRIMKKKKDITNTFFLS